MYYEFTVAIKQRKCHFCNKKINKGDKHFRMCYWKERDDFPTKKNACTACASTFYDSDWIEFLKEMLERAEELRALNEPLKVKLDIDKSAIYECERCHAGQVVWNNIFEKFQCSQCRELYEEYDLNRLRRME